MPGIIGWRCCGLVIACRLTTSQFVGTEYVECGQTLDATIRMLLFCMFRGIHHICNPLPELQQSKLQQQLVNIWTNSGEAWTQATYEQYIIVASELVASGWRSMPVWQRLPAIKLKSTTIEAGWGQRKMSALEHLPRTSSHIHAVIAAARAAEISFTLGKFVYSYLCHDSDLLPYGMMNQHADDICHQVTRREDDMIDEWF